MLSGDSQASVKFWMLDKRIKDDKKCTGVAVRDISRSHMLQRIDLIYEGAISEDDLKDFSEDLQDTIKIRLEIDRKNFGR